MSTGYKSKSILFEMKRVPLVIELLSSHTTRRLYKNQADPATLEAR
jgi:hypothetical protein